MGEAPAQSGAVYRLREQVLKYVTWLVIFGATPLMLLVHLGAFMKGNYGLREFAQEAVHAVICALLLTASSQKLRAGALIVGSYVGVYFALFQFGPTMTLGLVLFSTVLLARIFFGKTGSFVMIGLVVFSLVSAAVRFSRGDPVHFGAAIFDLSDPFIWLRLTTAMLVYMSLLTVLLGSFISGLEEGVHTTEEALARERKEREEKEKADLARRDAERALSEAQRQELMGRLAAGAAHDLNNVLTVIMGGAELAELAVEEGDYKGATRDLRDILDAARRGSAMGRQLLSFSKQQPTQPQHIYVDALVSGLGNLLRRLLPSNIALDISCEGDLPELFADPAQVEQAVMNLVVNARDALPEGGEIVVRAKGQAAADGTPGVAFSVTDNGVGIPVELQDKILTPFFTTKGGGRGTGIGLATVRTIGEQYSGSLRFESQVGQGTSFCLWLPATQSQGNAPDVAETPASPTSTHHGKRILVADDDAAIRPIAARMLRNVGYDVVLASDGNEAIAKVRERSFDLAVLDAIMPGPSGAKLVQLLEDIQPNLRILCCTGYDPGVFGNDFFASGERKLLSKPYRFEELIKSVQEVLDDNGTSKRPAP